MPFRIERNDITKVHTESIVNTANPMPTYGSGTDTAVYEAAGMAQLLAERKKIGVIERGQSAYTSAFNLQNTNGIKYIIHTVGTRWKDGQHGEIEIMRNCYRSSLQIAKDLNCKSLSIPLLATGNYGFPKETALNIALDEISKFLFENEMDIVLVVFDKESLQVSSKIFDGVQSFINDKEPAKENSLEDYLQQSRVGLNFQDLLRKHILEKGLDNPTVYKRSIIVDKKLFSKIINGHIPSKHSVMALGLALELDLESFEFFLATANYALNPSDPFDTIVKYSVTQKIYDVMQVDSILFQMGLPCFNQDKN